MDSAQPPVATGATSHIAAEQAPSRATRDGLRISAVIPLYNGANYIETALDSALTQNRPADEIIVVDDGSTDRGPEIVESIATRAPIRLLRKPNGGQSSARNLGIREATGDLIALLDQDDWWYPDHLSELSKPFLEQRRRNLGWVYSNLDEVDEQGRMVLHSCLRTLPFYHPKTDLFECLKYDMFVVPSATLVARSAVEAVGGFDETLSGYEDDDFFLRLFRAGFDNAFIELPLTKWRIHRGSSSYSYRMADSRAKYLRKLLHEFPDRDARGRTVSRDCLVPRFLPHLLADYRVALMSRSPARVRQAAETLALLARCHNWKMRLAMGVLLPVLKNPALGRLALPLMSGLRPMARRMLR